MTPDILPEDMRPMVTVNSNGCWVWGGPANGFGYGRHKRSMAHRLAYVAAKGPIPKGLQTDHLCRNTLCCNPEHLEAVTARENTLRSNNPAAHNARKTHCKNGHELNSANAYTYPSGRRRRCRVCQREYFRQRYANERRITAGAF